MHFERIFFQAYRLNQRSPKQTHSIFYHPIGYITKKSFFLSAAKKKLIRKEYQKAKKNIRLCFIFMNFSIYLLLRVYYLRKAENFVINTSQEWDFFSFLWVVENLIFLDCIVNIVVFNDFPGIWGVRWESSMHLVGL